MRVAAALIAVAALGAIAIRIGLRLDREGKGLLEALWVNARFFTIWTNFLIGLACARIAIGRSVSASALSGLLLSILIVAAVFHTLLGTLRTFEGIDWVVNHLLHSLVPAGFAVFWLSFVDKGAVLFRDIPKWLVLPLVYCLYIMTRAALDGVSPYPFLNLAALGPVRTGINIVGLLAAFAVVACGIVLLAKTLTRRTGAS